MSPHSSGWWTDEKVDATVTSRYVHSHLRPNEAEQLTKSVLGDLSDDTYLEWILTRSKRFFLTLVEAGVPDQIFGIIDDSYDDEDLPIPEDEVQALLLSAEPDPVLDQRFYRAQFKYLIRVVGDGEHIRYAQEETIPVNPLGTKPVIGSKGKDGLERVKLPSDNRRVFARKHIALRTRHMEEELLAEMAHWRNFAHGHVISIFGSYTTEDHLFVLVTPAPEYTLKSFLNDTPKAFEALTKTDRRNITLQWLHCLANGLAWLHTNGRHHGAIRPSRVCMDERFRVYFGQFDGIGILCDNTIKDDIEAYQYAAPERWKRSVTVQSIGSARTILPSGGRTARRPTLEAERSLSGGHETEHASGGLQKLNITRPTSVSYVFNPTSRSGSKLRLGSTKNAVLRIGSALRQTESRQSIHGLESQRPVRTSLEMHLKPGTSPALSSGSSETHSQRRQNGPIYAASPEMRTAVVQTWASAQHDQFAADVFSLGAIMMDILTFICKHSHSSFVRHRATKNKSAGRGGGLADASFHANIGQVFSWAETLQKDAEKKIKKGDESIFKAVGPCLQVVLQCLEREPSGRLYASELETKLCDHIRDFGGLNTPDCCLEGEIDRLQDRPQSRGASLDMLKKVARQTPYSDQNRSQGRPESRQALTPAVADFAPRIDSLRISPDKIGSLTYEGSTVTETLVNSEQRQRPKSTERPDSFAFSTGDSVEVFPRPPTSSNRARPTRDQVMNSATATPVLRANRAIPSIATSTIGGLSEDLQSVYSYTPPPTAHPTRELPPIPRTTSLRNRTPPTGNSGHSALRNTIQRFPAPSDGTSTTALPAMPDDIPQHQRPRHHRMPSRVGEDTNEVTRTESNSSATATATNQRHYRTSSRAGMAENRNYVNHVGRDKMALRGLQYP